MVRLNVIQIDLAEVLEIHRCVRILQLFFAVAILLDVLLIFWRHPDAEYIALSTSDLNVLGGQLGNVLEIFEIAS